MTVCAERSFDASRGPHRLEDPALERVRQPLDERQSVVERDVERRRLAEPAADDVAAPLPQEAVEHPVTAADDGLVVDLERESGAGHELIFRRVEEPFGFAVDAGKRQASPDVEVRARNTRRGFVQRCPGRRFHRLHRGEVEGHERCGCSSRSMGFRTHSAGPR